MTTQQSKEVFSKEETRVIADTMLAQMGGGRFLVMVGGRALYGTASDGYPELTVAFKAANPKRINRVTVALCWTDTYRVQFWRVSKTAACSLVHEMDDVYAEDLIPLFESVTGLRTSL